MAMMIRKIRLAGALALVFLSPDIAAADGALAIGAASPIVQGGLAYGFTRHFSPRESAQAVAVDTCRKLANVPQTAASCRVVGMFTDQCFAIAFTPQAAPTGFGWAIEADRQMAVRKAMNLCAGMAGDDAKSCKVVESRCDGTTLSDQCGGRAGASPGQRIASCTALIGSGDESDSDIVSDHVNRGNAHSDAQEFDEAILDYDDALKRDPTHAVAFYDRGTAYRMKQDHDKAIADYGRAIALNPRYEDAFVNRGVAYAAKGDLDRAIADYTTALLLDSADATAYRNRGDVYLEKGEPSLAMDDYNEAITRAPADTSGYRSRGYLHFYLGDFARAADDLAHVVTSERDDLYAMLWAYLAAARTDAESARRNLAQAATRKGQAWPYPAVELFLGGRTFESTLAAVGNPSERCEAQFYGGEWKLLQGDRAAAALALTAAADTCPKSFIEHKGAEAELKRLRQ
jgi:lipoprotein NlpI